MENDKDFVDLANTENGMTKINRALFKKLIECDISPLVASKPAYNLAQMYMQSLDFLAKSNELVDLTETPLIVAKIVEIREAVKSLRHYSEEFGRSYYVLMDKINSQTEEWLDDAEEDERAMLDEASEILAGLKSDDLSKGLRDEQDAHIRKQYRKVIKTLISKACPEDAANYFSENLFELQLEARNLVGNVDQLVSLKGDSISQLFDVEEIMVEISIPWVGFSPGETAHALWHMGNHDEDNFFFMGFLGWSLAVLENLQDNVEDI
ncbi:MAG: hypothetical protein HY779_01040 [Rubrobacteridae bacterium]|nr:hypothetical protein [Rubrobacteridae bacterium]